MARRQGREQAYLASLAGQYRLEQYPDSYEAMCEYAGCGGGRAPPEARPGVNIRLCHPCSRASCRSPPTPRASSGLRPP